MSAVQQALELLVQLGENRADAVQWIDRVIASSETQENEVQELVGAVYRLKASR